MARLQRIAIKDIVLNDDRQVGGKGALERLKASIAKVGLINPITVRKSTDSAFPYTIIAGRRRVEAAILLDWTGIDAVVYEADEAADASFFSHIALAENVNRLDLHPLDEGAQYARLLKAGYTLDDLAAYFDRSTSHIYQRMKLCDLIEEMQGLFRRGQIRISAAAKIASLPKRVQKQIYQALPNVPMNDGATEKIIDGVIRQVMRMPLDFPCEECERCTKKRTHYSNSLLFPEYRDQSDYCMDSRCYEKNMRNFYQKGVSEFLKNWSDAKTVYIYEEDKEKAEYLRSILEKKPLIEAVPVHVYHESFEDCSAIRILDEEETDAVYSSSKEVLKQCDIMPVLYPQYGMYQEPVFYIAVDEETYERLFPDTPYETMQEEIDRKVDTDNCSNESDTDTQETYSDNGAYSAFGAEQEAAERGADAREKPLLTSGERFAVFKQTVLEYLRQEQANAHHPFFHSTTFLHILEKRPCFEEAFQIIMGCTLDDFYQKKKYEDLTYRILLEIYVYSDLIVQGLANYHQATVVNGVPILKEQGLDGDTWRTLYQNVRYHFLQERAYTAQSETASEQAEKKTTVTAGT